MAAARDRRRRIFGKCTQAASSTSSSGAQSGSGWCTSLRTARRILACQQFSSACLHAARLGRVLNAYSGDELVYNKTLGDWRTHNGGGLRLRTGRTGVRSCRRQGDCVDTDGRWGSVVCIEDSAGHLWRVCGTADPTVQTGDEVSVGQILGRAGSIPNECAEETHIHLEVLQGEQYLDPAKLLN